MPNPPFKFLDSREVCNFSRESPRMPLESLLAPIGLSPYLGPPNAPLPYPPHRPPSPLHTQAGLLGGLGELLRNRTFCKHPLAFCKGVYIFVNGG